MTIQTNKLKTPMEKAIEQTLIFNQDNKFMEKMTIEKAREINKHENERGSWEWLRNFIGEPFCKTFKCESIFGEARGFIEGWNSREAEIEELKIIIKGLQGGWKMTTDAWVKVKE